MRESVWPLLDTDSCVGWAFGVILFFFIKSIIEINLIWIVFILWATHPVVIQTTVSILTDCKNKSTNLVKIVKTQVKYKALPRKNYTWSISWKPMAPNNPTNSKIFVSISSLWSIAVSAQSRNVCTY